jgi:hypothetical protein
MLNGLSVVSSGELRAEAPDRKRRHLPQIVALRFPGRYAYPAIAFRPLLPHRDSFCLIQRSYRSSAARRIKIKRAVFRL